MCTHSVTTSAPQIRFWRPTDGNVGLQGTGRKIWRPDVYKLINERIDELDAELRELNLDIHGTCSSPYACATPIFNVLLQIIPNLASKNSEPYTRLHTYTLD